MLAMLGRADVEAKTDCVEPKWRFHFSGRGVVQQRRMRSHTIKQCGSPGNRFGFVLFHQVHAFLQSVHTVNRRLFCLLASGPNSAIVVPDVLKQCFGVKSEYIY